MTSPLQRTRLEKAAADCGFELSPSWSGDMVTMRSARFPESVQVTLLPDDTFALEPSLAVLLPPERPAITLGWAALYELLDTASARAHTLPNRVAQRFQVETAKLPKSTEAERLVVQRVGQNLFRDALLSYWQGQCCVTGLDVPPLLRASHIRPWAQCESDEQRLDVFNGLLLAPHLDALFDGGWVTFADDGQLITSSALLQSAKELLGISATQKIAGLSAGHLAYLSYHRGKVFRE
jgi:putative restriction endonuclease